jgi:hypothetical protein
MYGKFPKKTNIEFAQNAPIILKKWYCCRKNRIDKNIFMNKSCRK